MQNALDIMLRLVLQPLKGAVERTVDRARVLELSGRAATFAELQDLRTEALADLMDALDEIEPGLGTILHLQLYPGADALRSGGELGRRAA